MAAPELSPVIAATPAARGSDGVVLVVQDNAAQALTIQSMNSAVETLLGFEEGEMNGRRLETILAPRLIDFIGEELDFTGDGPDLGELLARQRELRLRHRMGHELSTQFTLTRLVAQGGQSCFRIAIPNERDKLAAQKLREFIRLNLEGRAQIEADTGLPNRDTALSFLPLFQNYLAESEVSAAFAVISLDRHGKSMARYGAAGVAQLLQHIARCCKSAFRSEDLLFSLGRSTLGLVLFDIERESARVVLNRLRWAIRNRRIEFQGRPDFSLTISVVFDMIGHDERGVPLAACEAAADALDPDGRNTLVELEG